MLNTGIVAFDRWKFVLNARERCDATRHTDVRWLNAILVLAALMAGEGRPGALASPPPNVSGIYVANSGSNSITVYALGASGDIAPLRIISGASTRLSNPWGVALDAAGYLYVANGNSITVYAPGAGAPPGSSAANVAPIRAIGGTGIGLFGPIGVALDAAGYLYVSFARAIRVYAPIAFGPLSSGAYIAPVREILTGLEPRGIAVDPNGSIYVANGNSLYRTGGGSIDVYAPGAGGSRGTSAANAGALLTINGAATRLDQPAGLALDGTRNLYVANDSSITVYPPDTGGFWDSPQANVTPIRTINGTSTRLSNPWGVALDATGHVYVSNATANSITVYAPSAGGPPGSSAADVAPIRTISGRNTGLSLPYLIFLRP